MLITKLGLRFFSIKKNLCKIVNCSNAIFNKLYGVKTKNRPAIRIVNLKNNLEIISPITHNLEHVLSLKIYFNSLYGKSNTFLQPFEKSDSGITVGEYNLSNDPKLICFKTEAEEQADLILKSNCNILSGSGETAFTTSFFLSDDIDNND